MPGERNPRASELDAIEIFLGAVRPFASQLFHAGCTARIVVYEVQDEVVGRSDPSAHVPDRGPGERGDGQRAAGRGGSPPVSVLALKE